MVQPRWIHVVRRPLHVPVPATEVQRSTNTIGTIRPACARAGNDVERDQRGWSPIVT